MPSEDTTEATVETPAYARSSKTMARTRIVAIDDEVIEVNEPYRTVLSRLNKARTHFEVTKAGPGRKKMSISVDIVATISEI